MALGIQYLNMKLIPSFFYKQWDYVYASVACVKLCCERMNIFGERESDKRETDREREGGMFQLYFSSYYFVLDFGLCLEVAKAMRNLLKPMKEDDSLNSVGQPLPSIFPFQFSLI